MALEKSLKSPDALILAKLLLPGCPAAVAAALSIWLAVKNGNIGNSLLSDQYLKASSYPASLSTGTRSGSASG